MTADGILAISALIAACGVALDAAELLGPNSPLDRYFAWEATRFRPMLRRLTQTGPLKWALGVQVAAAFAVAPLVLWAGPAGALLGSVVLAVHLLVRIRAPLSSNGADYMQLIVWSAVVAYGLAGGSLGRSAALWFVAGNAVVAYVTAGLKKLSVPGWRDGTVLGSIMATETFGTPALVPLLHVRPLAAVAAWGTLGFETLGPFLILLGPPGALTFAAIATLFHVGIAATMGLNRFVFAFGAALPSTYWISAPLHDLATSSLSTLLHITSPVLGL